MKNLVRLLAVAGTIVLAVTLLSAPSQAAPAGYLHLYYDDHYKGPTMGRSVEDSDLHNDRICFKNDGKGGWYFASSCKWYEGKSWMGDNTSSLRNETGYWWKTYHDKKYKGYTMCVRPYGYDNNLGNNTPEEDDISSIKRDIYDPNVRTRPKGCDQVIG